MAAENQRYIGNTGGINMYDTLNALWRCFVAEGVIRGEEYVRLTLPHYYKTVEEFTQPLTDTASPVYRVGLRLEQWEMQRLTRAIAACGLPANTLTRLTFSSGRFGALR